MKKIKKEEEDEEEERGGRRGADRSTMRDDKKAKGMEIDERK